MIPGLPAGGMPITGGHASSNTGATSQHGATQGGLTYSPGIDPKYIVAGVAVAGLFALLILKK